MNTLVSYEVAQLMDDGRDRSLVGADWNVEGVKWHLNYYTKECGYKCLVFKYTVCATCGSTGKVPATRGKKIIKWQTKVCPDCKGNFPSQTENVTDLFIVDDKKVIL